MLYGRSKKILDAFISGECEILIGVASYRSPLARGLDLPERVRYAIFAGVPKFRIKLSVEERFSPSKAIILLANLRDFLSEEEQLKVDAYIARLRRISSMVSREEVKKIVECIDSEIKLSGFLGSVQKFFIEVRDFIRKLLAREDIKRAIKESPYLSLRVENGEAFLVIPDPVAYIQASGRTSRMYAGGVSKGLSVVVVDDEKAFRGLMSEVLWFDEDIEWKNLDEVDIKEIIEAVDRDRELIRKISRGEEISEFKDPIKSVLFVVESPNKARTIARFFGKPGKRKIGNLTVYEVSTGDAVLSITASGGHIFDVVTEGGLYGILVSDGNFIPIYSTVKKCLVCGETFTNALDKCPYCGSDKIRDKMEVVKALREIASEVDMIYIGTDADAEGEKIGWDIARVLAPYSPNIKRIEFHEVTKRALMNALKEPREINVKLVEAQLVRRIEDRWIGFALSEKLWSKFKRRELSAGRVQTPVLGWIIKRTLESRRSVMEHFEIKLENGIKFTFKIDKRNRSEVEKLKKKILENVCMITDVETSIEEVNPLPPYSTDMMLRDAASILKLGVNQIMRLAQDLFELGLITYHRTDSIRVSSAGISVAKNYIEEKFGAEVFKGRVWSKEGAHECIRPTRPIDSGRLRQLLAMGAMRLAKRLSSKHLALYEIIFRRFIISQMSPAKLVKQKFKVRMEEPKIEVEVSGFTKILEPGFTLMKRIHLIPEVSEGPIKVISVRHWRAPTIKLFTQGEIIEEMKKRGIGRPSTYAKIVQTLFKRNYIMDIGRGRLTYTNMGMKVYEYLSRRFKDFVSEETTRQLEEYMDLIEAGKMDYQEILRELYDEIQRIRTTPP